MEPNENCSCDRRLDEHLVEKTLYQTLSTYPKCMEIVVFDNNLIVKEQENSVVTSDTKLVQPIFRSLECCSVYGSKKLGKGNVGAVD